MITRVIIAATVLALTRQHADGDEGPDRHMMQATQP
jgi:hypothetical protein